MSSVRDFGVRGNGVTDDSAALAHALQRCDGELLFPRGDYVLSRTLLVPLAQHGRLTLAGQGGTARLLMRGAGPALHLTGTHRRSAHPEHLTDAVWQRERMPTIRDLEIVGQHDEADGIRLEATMQATLTGLLIRTCRHGVHLTANNRNIIIADCHIYNNRGVGVFFDRVNLHQTNIHGNHISYNKQGGIKIVGSEIRNLQICSNDIEYNHDLQAASSNDILFDCREGTVREGTLVGNTVQAVGTPGGACIRFLGHAEHPNAVGLFTIAGNLIGSQTTLLDLHSCRSIVVSGNSLYSGFHNTLVAENCEHLVFSGNSIDHNPEYRGNSTDRVLLRRCRHVNITGLVHQHTRPLNLPAEASIELHDCENVNVTGCQLANVRQRGILLQGCQVTRIADCTIRGAGDGYLTPLGIGTGNRQLMLSNNFLGRGREGEVRLPAETGTMAGNVYL